MPVAIGTNSDAASTDDIVTTGAILNTTEVVLLMTKSFFINLIKSYKGWNNDTPFLPAQKAFVFLITPIIRKGTNKRIIKFKSFINILFILFFYLINKHPTMIITRNIKPYLIYV